jgi:cold shock CspA family protein
MIKATDSSLRTRVTRTFSCTSIAGNGFKTLEEGARVTYEATQGRMGMEADNVSRV